MGESRVVFAPLIESLGRILAPLDEPTRARLKAAGIDLGRILPAYPVETWYAGIAIALDRFDPALSAEEKQNRFGIRLVEVYGETLVGRAMYGMMRIIGPERTIQRATRSFRTATNFLETFAVQHGPRDWELTMNEVVFPHRYPGFFDAVLKLAGARNPKTRLVRLTDTHATWRATWE